jgi:hypothetical protein
MAHNTELNQYLIDEINQEYQNWLDLISGLTPEQLTRRPEDGWSVIDTLIHVTAWQGNAIKIAKEQKDPGVPVPDPQFGPSRVLHIYFEDFNQEIFQAHKDWSLKQALDWFEKTDVDLRSALLELPEERLFPDPNKRQPFNWFWRPAIVHSREHRMDIEERFKEEN